MNLQYLRYALEISRTGSISKAAENLSVAQPNLSRAVKELEAGLGISIFDRTRTGMTVTPEGEKLLSTGARILQEVDELETMFDGEETPRQTLTITVPHAAYLAHALSVFCRDLEVDGRYDIVWQEAGASDAIGAVTRGESRLGIIRYPAHFETYYTDQLTSQDLRWEPVADFPPVILAGKGSPLAACEAVTPADLAGLYEVVSPDLPLSGRAEQSAESLPARRLTVSDRGARQEILCADPSTYERSLPVPREICERLGLLTRPLTPSATVVRDILIYPAHYRLTPLDRELLLRLKAVAKDLL